MASISCTDQEARQQLISIYGRITPETTIADIQRWKTEPGFSKLVFLNRESEVFILTPMEFSAKNWQICIGLVDKKVSRARIGTVDYCGQNLPDAPPPKDYGGGKGAF